MNYSQKLALISILPILIISVVIFYIFEQQSKRLIDSQSKLIEEVILEQKRAELRNYVALAERAIAPSYNSVLKTRRRAQSEANEILRKMSANKDQYFFVYNGEGENIVEPRLTWFIGKNWLRLQDRDGRFIIQETIEAAKEEDAFVSYVWQKPSTKDYTQKLVHAAYFPKWDWVVGTGIYLDDVEGQTSAIQSELFKSLERTRQIGLALALGAILVTGLILTTFQVSQHRLADAELRRLNDRLNSAQENERKRVSTELHDGISQMLVSAKYALEHALEPLNSKSEKQKLAQKAYEIIDDAIGEVRSISRALRPTALDDMGLAAALTTLANEFEQATGIETSSNVRPMKNLLSEAAKTALYRVAQEAFANVAKHSGAKSAELKLFKRAGKITLVVADDGSGFDPRKSETDEGLGLRNMSERIDQFGGSLQVNVQSGAGCKITARLPIERDHNKRSI